MISSLDESTLPALISVFHDPTRFKRRLIRFRPTAPKRIRPYVRDGCSCRMMHIMATHDANDRT